MMAMVRMLGKGSRDIYPALAILLLTILFSLLYDDSVRVLNWPAIIHVPLRFLRFAFLLCISLFVLPKIYGFITRKKSAVLLQVGKDQAFTIEPIRHWVFRPFQGIGIGMLFSTKLLSILQLVAGPRIDPSLLIPEGHFQVGRFLMISLTTAFVAVLLSLLWSFDDMGVRYFNRKDHELKMIGKYVGTVMPVIFGFYGVMNLLGSYPVDEAVLFTFKIAVVLYPPLTVFSVLHTYYMKSRSSLFLKSHLRQSCIRVEES